MIGYLLDTNHCSRILDGDPAVTRRVRGLGRAAVATCVIVRGEPLFMARRSERASENRAEVDSLLRDMIVWPVDDESSDIYAEIKVALLNRFGPREKARRRQFDIATLGFGENDLWIAAIAVRRGLTVVSADDDFRRMAEVSTLEVESWWSPRQDQAPPAG